jgi:hypothetical protein
LSIGLPRIRSSTSIEYEAMPFFWFSTAISIRNGWPANTCGGGRRLTSSPRIVTSDSTPEAMMNDSSQASSR